MPDFQFVQNPISKKWIILAPSRASRPDVAKREESVCPFCFAPKPLEVETVRIVANKFPFAPIHEIIVHSPDHHKNFGELPEDQVRLIFKTYRERYNKYRDKGQVYIFHNRGEAGGESLPHPHTQLAVVPFGIEIDIPRLNGEFSLITQNSKLKTQNYNSKVKSETIETRYFELLCPKTSQWPDEVWIAPQRRGRLFGEITEEEIRDLSHIITRLIEVLSLRHGAEFPFNFYIYPSNDWYLRLIPRSKVLGGFEIGTGIFINTKDPKETIRFIKEHFENF